MYTVYIYDDRIFNCWGEVLTKRGFHITNNPEDRQSASVIVTHCLFVDLSEVPEIRKKTIVLVDMENCDFSERFQAIGLYEKQLGFGKVSFVRGSKVEEDLGEVISVFLHL